MHASSAVASAILSNLNTVKAMLYTAASGKKVIIVGSMTLSAGGESGNAGSKPLSVGANGIIVGSKIINFSAFGTSKPNSGGLIIGGTAFSLAGIYGLSSSDELQKHHTSSFPPPSPTIDPNIPQGLPTVVIVNAQRLTVDPAGQYLVDGKTFTVKDISTEGAELATMISDQLVASTAKATVGSTSPKTAGPQPSGSSSTLIGLGQLIVEGFNGGGGTDESGGAGSRAPGEIAGGA